MTPPEPVEARELTPLTDASKRLLEALYDEGVWPDEPLVLLREVEAEAALRAEAARPSEGMLRDALERIFDHGCQPRYNGRPSCPFCHNFVDEEETHTAGCVLRAALDQPRSGETAPTLDANRHLPDCDAPYEGEPCTCVSRAEAGEAAPEES